MASVIDLFFVLDLTRFDNGMMVLRLLQSIGSSTFCTNEKMPRWKLGFDTTKNVESAFLSLRKNAGRKDVEFEDAHLQRHRNEEVRHW